MRDYWTFLESYSDVYEQLNNKQKVAFMDALIDVQKLRIKVDDVTFTDKTLRIVWAGLKHTIKASINGYLAAQKNKKEAPYLGVYDENNETENTPLEGARQHPNREPQSTPLTISNKEISNKEIRNKQEAIINLSRTSAKKVFSFNLKQKTKFSNLSDEYKTKLKEKIEALIQKENYTLSYENFKNGCLANGYVYLDFNLAYQNWAKREHNKQNKNYPQNKTHFSEQEAQEILERVNKPNPFMTFGDLNIDELTNKNTKEAENAITAEIEYDSRVI